MALSTDLLALRDRVLGELISAHDYYVDTQTAWSLVGEMIVGGRRIATQNEATGTLTTEAELLAKADGYIVVQLAEATFAQFLSRFENFFFELLTLWLTHYPQSLGRKTIDFRSILEAPDKDAITDLVVRKELNEVLYDRPSGWFAYLEEKARLGCPSVEEIERIGEAKATRDVLVHNRGVANRTYAVKSGRLARFRDGERIDIPEPYHREIWELLRKVVADVADAAVAKAPG